MPEKRDSITIGFLSNLPPIAVPYQGSVDFYGLRRGEQGRKLLLEGRIDALITFAGRYKNEPGMEPAPYPALRRVDLGLVCHDSQYARIVLDQFDRRIQLVKSAGDEEG